MSVALSRLHGPIPVLFLGPRRTLMLRLDGETRAAACRDCGVALRLEVDRKRSLAVLVCDHCEEAAARFRVRKVEP